MKVHKLTTITQRKATVFMDERTDRLEEREKAIIAIVHEIRNPLTAVKLTSQLMQEAFDREERDRLLMQSYMIIIANNIERIENYLTAAMTYRKREIAVEPVNVCDCIDKALYEAKDRLYLSGITVSNNYKGSYWVYGNEEKLITAFLNIIVNSIEAIKINSGKIWVSVYGMNNTLRITFKDNGSGMEPAVAQKIFDPHLSTKDGIGIGLYSVKEIMNLHKASIVADSLPGISTSVTIVFNSIPEEDVPAIAEAGKRARFR